MTISTATPKQDYLDVLTRADLTYSDKCVLLYMLHPAYRNQSWRGHCDLLKMSINTFVNSLERLEERGYIEVTVRGEGRNRLRNFNCYRTTAKARRLYGVAA